MSEYYLLIKSAHVTAVLIFIGGLLSQHSALRTEKEEEALGSVPYFSRNATTVAMFSVWAFGFMLANAASWFPAHWLQLKLVFVLVLSAVHGMQTGYLRRCRTISRHFKCVLLWVIVASVMAIVFLAILKPEF